MTLRHMRIFVAVCKYNSITAAAEKLYLAQPTVSLAIKEMEAYYGVALFDRISHKLYLSETGKLFLSYATHIVSLFDELDTKIRNADTIGLLRIGASITTGSYLLPKLVSLFNISHPNIKVQVVIENSEELENRILANDIDFALIEGTVHNSQIEGEKMMEDKLVLVCGKSHVLAKADCVGIDQLQQYNFILREKGSGTRELFDSTLLVYGVSIKPSWESVSTHAIVNAVSEGLGLSVLPYLMVKEDIDAGRIKQLELKDIHFARSIYMIHHKNKFLPISATEFMSLCKSESKALELLTQSN